MKIRLFRSFPALACTALALALTNCERGETPPAPTPAMLASGGDDLLRNAELFTLLSLDPRPVMPDEQEAGQDEVFHEYNVLGTLDIPDKSTRERLLGALYRGIADDDPNMAIDCFNPRHGIRAERDGATIELLICFECASLNIYEDGRQIGNLGTTSEPQAVFDRVLREAKVPLPDR